MKIYAFVFYVIVVLYCEVSLSVDKIYHYSFTVIVNKKITFSVLSQIWSLHSFDLKSYQWGAM